MPVRPKHRAVTAFSVGGVHFAKGDPVPAGVALDAALRFGDRFVTVVTKRTKQSDQSASSGAADNQPSADADTPKEQ